MYFLYAYAVCLWCCILHTIIGILLNKSTLKILEITFSNFKKFLILFFMWKSHLWEAKLCLQARRTIKTIIISSKLRVLFQISPFLQIMNVTLIHFISSNWKITSHKRRRTWSPGSYVCINQSGKSPKVKWEFLVSINVREESGVEVTSWLLRC